MRDLNMGSVQNQLPRFLIILLLVSLLPFTSSQSDPPPAPSPQANSCNGIFVSYRYKTGEKIPPTVKKDQPYRFESELTVLNRDRDALKSWRVFVGFAHDELLVSASNAVLADGSTLPARVGNGTVFSGFPATDLKSAIETAGDLTQMQARVELVGTQFGVVPPAAPLPKEITLANDGWVCPKAEKQGSDELQVCCTRDPKSKSSISVEDGFLPRQKGDLTIMYDVTQVYGSNYWARVTIENHNTLGRLDHWKLSFSWMRDEFIFSMKGAYPHLVDSTGCISGPQAKYYQELDFSKVLSCARRPVIVDLPPTMYNDTELGRIPFCCKNGTILPRTMDPSKSSSVFEMQVFKMPPDLNLSAVTPPQNWRINGTFNPDYECGQPVRVSPSHFADTSGLPSNKSAIASWQVVCNITQPKGSRPRCCVSFSAYFNDSVVPCQTCACGCPSRGPKICSAKAPAVLLPPEALLLPFENRTRLTRAWADLKHRPVPNPLPCGDNCGVSINWHLASDHRGGWTARITLFNWEEESFADWFAAVQMKMATTGFEKMYSFNATTLADNKVNDTIFIQGFTGLNYLVGEQDGKDPRKDPRVPGKQQSVVSFTKKTTPGINVAAGDGFPEKVFFNGEECSLPRIYPTNDSIQKRVGVISLLPLLLLLVFTLI